MRKNKRVAWKLSEGARDMGMLVAESDVNLGKYYVGRERYLDRALDMSDPRVFFMGPKGIGKSAILQMVRIEKGRSSHQLIDIAPDDLAFSAFANLKIESPLLTDALRGQWLFKCLWDYVLLMELWERENSRAQDHWDRFKALFMQTKDEKRIRRLFEITITDEGHAVTLSDRILELIREVELSAQAGEAGISGKAKIEHSGSKQFLLLAEINHAVKTLPSMLRGEYYVLIDDLDLHWVNDPNQNAFIAALFLSLRKLSRAPVKFLVSIREDIYNCLPLVDKDKSRDRLTTVEWDLNTMQEIITKRVVGALGCAERDVWGNVFPDNAFAMLARRSTHKPREFIRMASLSMERACINGHKRVQESDVAEALRGYSVERRQDLVSDLRYVYPGLDVVLERFRGREKEFPFGPLDEMATQLAIEALDRQDAPFLWAGQFDRRGVDFAELLADIGFLQVKENRTAIPKPYDRGSLGRIREDLWFAVHPMYAPGLELLGE